MGTSSLGSWSLRTLRVVVLLLTTAISFATLVLPISLRAPLPPLQVGDVSPRDIQAPRDFQYVSQVRTDRARQAAEKAVLPVYTAADAAVARQQIQKLRSALDAISSIRLDPATTADQKLGSLRAIGALSLSADDQQLALALPSYRWEIIQAEAVSVLDQMMRSAVRPDNLDYVRNEAASAVTRTLSVQDSILTADLVQAFIVPNSQYSQALTTAAQQAAADAVKPVVRSFKSGESVIRLGQVLTDEDLEALQQLGLVQTQQPYETYATAAAITVACAAFVALYFYRRPRVGFLSDARALLVVCLIFIVFIVSARLVIPNRSVVPYVFPLPAMALLLSALFGMESGLVLGIVVSVLASYGVAGSAALLPYYLFGSLLGIAALGQARRFVAFVRGGLGVAAAGAVMVIAYRTTTGPIDWTGLATLGGAALFSGLASAGVALLLQYLFAQFLKLPTALQLLEISRSDFPLLQEFLRKAPGTYQHALHVANLAEQAAEAIHADTLLTRVGATFHDIGKTAVDPSFFVENQSPGSLDTHADMRPEEAAAAIIRHVTDGVALAHRYHLPERLIDFIREHHGTMLARYQYNQALELAGGDASKVDAERFRYPGPAPRSKETALLMLADAAEARSRAQNPQTEEELREIVQGVIDRCVSAGQMKNAPLTFQDLDVIADALVKALRGTYHPRIEYPGAHVPGAPDPARNPS